MTSFKSILESFQREYNFRIKSVVDISNDMDIIERALMRYDALEIAKPVKTIMQNQPLDFIGIDAAEVWIVDAVVRVPVSAYALRLELCALLNVSENFIVVKSDNDPTEVESNRITAMKSMKDDPEFKEIPMLSTDPNYPEESFDASLIAGNAYNERFLDFLAKQTVERKEEEVVKTGSGLFAWLETNGAHVEDSEDFNKDIKDAPKVHNTRDAKKTTDKDFRGLDKFMSQHGNLDDDTRSYTKRFTKDNKEVKVTKSVKSIR